MGGIEYIKKPLHAFPFPPQAIISVQDRYRQECKELDNAIGFADEQKVTQCADYRPYDNVRRLSFEIVPVKVHAERAHNGNEGPVCRESNEACRG